MQIETIDIDSIKPYKNNPREIPIESVKKVADSIKEFGNNQPIVVDNDNVIVVLPFISSGQTEAVAPMTDEQLEKELNSSVTFLKDKKDYEDKGMLNIIINCKGEMVRCEIDNKTKSTDLDNEILAVFLKMKVWKAAKMGSKSVDSMVLYSFTIENGKIKF